MDSRTSSESELAEVSLESPRESRTSRGDGSIDVNATGERLMPCSMADFVEEVHASPRNDVSERSLRPMDLVEDAFISPRDAKRTGFVPRSSANEREWSLKGTPSDSRDASVTPRDLLDGTGTSQNTISPRSLVDITSDSTRASTMQRHAPGPNRFNELERTTLRTPRRSGRALEVIASCNGLHGRDLRHVDDTSPDPTAYYLPSASGRSATFGRAPRRVGSWALLKHVSSELTLDPVSPGADRASRFHRPTVSPRFKHSGRMSRVHGDVIVHDLFPDTDIGPGTYDVSRTLSTSSHRIGTSPRKLVSRIEKSPGPAEYQSSETWEKDWRCKDAKFTTLSQRSRAQMDKSARAPAICRGGDIFMQVSEAEQTPGPGAYHPDPMMLRRSASASELRTQHGRRSLGYLQATASSSRKSVTRARSSGSCGGSPSETRARRELIVTRMVEEASPCKASSVNSSMDKKDELRQPMQNEQQSEGPRTLSL